MNFPKKTFLLLTCVVVVFMFASIAGFGQTAASFSGQPAVTPTSAGNSPQVPHIWLQENQPLPVQHVSGAISSAQGMTTVDSGILAGLAKSQPVSMATADLDGDGFDDLVVGYSGGGGGFISVQRGNMDAFAPQSSASFQAIGRGEFPSPFHLEAQTFSIPVRPDFIALGKLSGSGNKDLVAAAKGGNVLYIFPGDGKGNFGLPQTMSVSAGVTALSVGEIGSGHTVTLIVGTTHTLTLYVSTAQGLTSLASYPVGGAVSNVLFGDFGDPGPDVAFLTGGTVQVLRSSTMQVATVSLPVTVRAFALGSFIYDRNGVSQIALVAPDGSVQIAVRNEFDPRPYSSDEWTVIRQAAPRGRANPLLPGKSFPVNGWKIVESFPKVGALSAGQTPVFFRTRISNHGADDVMLLNPSSGQLALISHPDVPQGATAFLPGQVSLRPYSGTPVAALAMRINVDGRPGVMAIRQGELAPSMLMPIPDPTFFVNTFNDPTPTSPIANACNNTGFADLSSSCSLREAVLKANGDTIMLQAGTYQLSLPKVAGDFSGQNGALYVNNTATFVGAVDGSGNPASIIQAGTTNSNGVDQVMAVNSDIVAFTDATASLSNLVIKFGHNNGTFAVGDGFGGAIEFDTGGAATATLTLTNCLVTDNSTTDGDGGGLALFNTNGGSGFTTITNSTIQNNSPIRATSGAAGGGIFAGTGGPAQFVLSNTSIINNNATQTSPATGNGGGIFAFGPGPSTRDAIHGGSISGNQSAGDGGGIETSAGLVIDTGTVISNNQAGTGGGGASGGNGAGLWFDASGENLDITKATIVGNSTLGGAGTSPGGGGIWIGSTNSLVVNLSFSRLAGNSAPNGSNLDFPVTGSGSSVNAVDNWWGTNAAATTINGAATFDPFIVLTHSGNPQKIRINQSSALTGDMSKDNHGTAVGLSNLTQIVGLPITFNNPVLGTIPDAQPETLNANAQATATFNAGGTGGFGTANATVDQAVVPVNSNLIASATESSSTATITTVGAHGFTTGEQVTISGVGVSGYNGTFSVASTPDAVTFTYTANTSGLGPSSGGTANAGIAILQPPSITKSFNPTTVAPNTASTITFSITNGNTVTIDSSFTDSLPAGLVVATPPNVVNACGGTVAATAGSGSISFANPSLAVGTCTIAVNVQSAVDNNYSNSVTINSADAGTGNTSSANLTVISAPAIAKAFGAASIPLNGTTSLTFTLTSTNTNLTLNGVAFTDSLPAGLVVATPGNLTNTCGGTATAANGSSSVALTRASLAPGASCTVSVNVQGTTGGVKSNSVSVTSTNGGTGNTSNASITVVSPPTLAKVFGAASIPLNGTTSLSFIINNPNSSNTLTGIGFTDTLPAGLVVSTPNGLTGSCGAGTITATAGTNVISLSGASLPGGGSCTFAVNVTGIAAGTQNNTSGNVTSNEGGTGGAASASIIVVAPPATTKVFAPSGIQPNGTSTMSITIANPAGNTVALTNLSFTDNFPVNVVVATPNGLTNTCGGTATAVAGSATVSLTGVTVAANSSCTVSVSVTSAATGIYLNDTGPVSSDNGGTGGDATATLSVAFAPTISKLFVPDTINQNQTTLLSFTINNPNSFSSPPSSDVTLTGIAFTDNLPTGLVIANPSNLSNSCDGTVTADPGSSVITLTGGDLGPAVGLARIKPQHPLLSLQGLPSSQPLQPPPPLQPLQPHAKAMGGSSTSRSPLPKSTVIVRGGSPQPDQPSSSGSCFISVEVQATVSVPVNTSVMLNNTTGPISANESGTGATSNTATLTVSGVPPVQPPTIAKAFGGSTVPLNGTTTLTLTFGNPNSSTTLNNVSVDDPLPSGLIASPNGVTGSCFADGGFVVVNGSGTDIQAVGSSLSPNTSCSFTINVTGTTSGLKNNTTGNVGADFNAGSETSHTTGGSASASIIVVLPPSIAKVFNPNSIPVNTTTQLGFTITNPSANPVALTGVGFTDVLPASLTVANGSSSVCGGTLTTSGGNTITLSGAMIAVNSTCVFSVTVTGTQAGSFVNTTGAVTSNEGGTGNTATSNLTVAAPPSITKAFGASTIPLNGTTSLTFTIQNPNTGVTLTGIAFIDSLPAGLVVATPSYLHNTCGGTATATAGSGSVSLSGGTLAPSASCMVSVNIQGTTAGVKNNSVTVSSTEGGTGNTSTGSITVVAPPAIMKQFGAATIPLNGTTSLSFTIQNSNSVGLTGVGFSDTLPSGLVISTPNGLTGSCGGGTITATQNTGVISLSGGSLAANTSCTFSVNVTGTSAGTKNNTTGAVTSNEGGTGGTASGSIIVVAPPVIAKAFNPSSIALSQTTSLGFTITNPSPNPIALTGVGFTDVLQTGLTVANGSSAVCGGTLTTSGGNTISLSGATIAANSSCNFSVTVTPTAFGNYTNTTSHVTSNEGGTGNAAVASLTVFPVVISPGSVNFGDVDSDQSATTTVTISNNGNAAVSLSISLTPGTGTSANNFTFSTNCPSSLAAHHSCTVTITFTAPHVTSASQLGVSTATLNVVSAGFTQHVPLSANVIDPEPQFTPGSLSFGHVTVNHSSTQALTLKNVGLTALNITGFTVTGNTPADFTFQNLCPASLAPGNSCTINVTFTPKATGNRDAKLNLIANDEVEFVPISGIGQ